MVTGQMECIGLSGLSVPHQRSQIQDQNSQNHCSRLSTLQQSTHFMYARIFRIYQDTVLNNPTDKACSACWWHQACKPGCSFTCLQQSRYMIPHEQSLGCQTVHLHTCGMSPERFVSTSVQSSSVARAVPNLVVSI